MVSATAPATRRKKQRFKRAKPKTLLSIPEECSIREWHIFGSASVAAEPRNSMNQRNHGISEEEIAATTACYKLIDIERKRNRVHALAQSEKLHQLARLHANRMAQKGRAFHSVRNVSELEKKLQSPIVGENVERGKSALDMHKATMKDLEQMNRKNILGRNYQEYGVAAARGLDGGLYICQYFR